MTNFLLRQRAMWQPDMFHGWGRTRRYFEGWYFKFVNADESAAYAVIPGIAYEPDGSGEAFIQVFNGTAHQAVYHRFPHADFQPAKSHFSLRLGDNYFSAKEMELNLPELSGRLTHHGNIPWPKMLGAPGIMGWYSFVPFMQCYHGVVSLGHELAGQLATPAGAVDFTGGKGYIEKDWGRSFPSSWIWVQSSHLSGPDAPVCLMASVARIPWLGSSFVGYIVGFHFGGQLYRFATYTGAQMRARIEGETVRVGFKDRRYRLEIAARHGGGADLLSPLSGAMRGKVNESLQADINIQFYEQDELRYEGRAKTAGLEVAGPVEELLTESWRR